MTTPAALLRALLAAACVAAALPAAAAGYDVRTVDIAGAADTALYAINDRRCCVVGADKDRAGRHHAIDFDGGGAILGS